MMKSRKFKNTDGTTRRIVVEHDSGAYSSYTLEEADEMIGVLGSQLLSEPYTKNTGQIEDELIRALTMIRARADCSNASEVRSSALHKIKLILTRVICKYFRFMGIQ